MAKSIWKKMMGWAGNSGTESRRFSGYNIRRLIHEGDKAFVHQARSPETGEIVAIKVYKPLYNRTARRICKRYHLRAEGELGMLINPGEEEAGEDWPIVRTLGHGYEFNDPGKCYYLILEFIDGINVKHLLGCDDPLLRKKRLAIAMGVARALKIIHDRGLIHRDICSDNIILTREHKVKLIDLGFMAPSGIAFVEKSGTPSYMSPEQFMVQPLGAAADIYAFGVLLFELFTKKLPFTSALPPDNPDLFMRRMSEFMTQHIREAPPRPSEITSDLPEGMEPIILKCLEKSPDYRYLNMRALLAALAQVQESA